MNWERVESARRRARFLLAISWFVAGFVLVAYVIGVPALQEPCFGCRPLVLTMSGIELSPPAHGIAIDTIGLAVGLFGLLVGAVWTWRIYRAPTRSDGAHWRFQDH